MRKMRTEIRKPLRPWESERIETEKKFMKKYGLRRKKEIYKAESLLRNYRRRARIIAAKSDKEGEKILLGKLNDLGMIERKDVDLGYVLDLNLDNILSRRLQTLVFEKGLANTILHSRQLITHGHIAIEGKRSIFPSFIVPKNIEGKINYYGNFKLKSPEQKKVEKPVEEKKIEDVKKDGE